MYACMHQQILFLQKSPSGTWHFNSCSNSSISYPLFFSASPHHCNFLSLQFLGMACIKNLHLTTLKRIFAYFYLGERKGDVIHEFRQLLPPAAVCRVWRERMLKYIYCIAYLECHVKETNEDKRDTQPEYEWKSNIDLILAQGLSHVIRQLRIWSFGRPHDFAGMIHALDNIGFGSGYWRNVNTLEIANNCKAVAAADNVSNPDYDKTLVTQLTEYFARHIPNVGDLWLCFNAAQNTSQLLSNELVNLYIRQLHSLVCYPTPITFSYRLFSPDLAYLHVGVSSGVTNRLPQLLASPLSTLILFDIPHNFAWYSFIGNPDYVEFTKLHNLLLRFRQRPDSAEESNGYNSQVGANTATLSIGHRKLLFPKLRVLIIHNSPYSDGALYSMFAQSPLESVTISGSLKSVQHVDPRILLNVADFALDVDSVVPDDYNALAEFYHQLLASASNVAIARLGVRQSNAPLPIPNAIAWVDLEDLTLRANIHLQSAVQIITQLPKLHTLKVENVVDEFDEAGASLQAMLGGSPIQVLPTTTSLKVLWIYPNGKLPLVFSLDVMCYLTILIHSLAEVVVPDLYVYDVKEFAAHHANGFSHLPSIKVFGTTEVYYW